MSGVEHTVSKVSEEALGEMLKSLAEGKTTASNAVSERLNQTLAEVQRIAEQQQRQADALKRQIIGSAEMTARNKSLEIIEENLNSAFTQAMEKLESSVKSADYERVLKAMVLEGIDQVGGDDFVVQGHARDQKLLKKLTDQVSKEKKVKIVLDSQPLTKSIGGASVRSADGFILFDNTYEARLERLKPTLRKQIAQLFTEQK